MDNPSTFGEEKTNKMNDMLNNLVPYFRCSDEDIVKIYYFLWSLQLMYYKGETSHFAHHYLLTHVLQTPAQG